MFARAFFITAFIGIASATAMTCPDAGNHILPHPTRCAKYYMCNNGQLAEQECSGTFVFNPKTNMCDFSSNVECEDAPDPVSEGPVGACSAVNGDYLTDASDCTVFYMCNWGVPTKMFCTGGLHFNPTLNVCDYPYRAGCTVQQ